MSNKSFDDYIKFIGISLKERALKAKSYKLDSDPKDLDFNTGYLMAFHEVIDFMKQQAPFFDLEQDDVGLNDIDADADLLGLHKKTNIDSEDAN